MALNIKEFGAKGNGTDKDTQAIQKALDKCFSNGGGTVVVPPGTFLAGTVYIKNNTNLYLQPGAVILGSPDLADYNPDDAFIQNFSSARENWTGAHLIIALESHNVSITGEGAIDGNSKAFFGPPPPLPGKDGRKDGRPWKSSVPGSRPGPMVCFVECSDIKIEGVEIKNFPQWAVFLHGCQGGNITGVKVFAPRETPTTDGLHITSCRNITVSNCRVDTGDDSITLTADSRRLKQNDLPCENIVVNNCIFSSDTYGIRILSWGVIRNCIISDCIFTNCRQGIQLMSNYGGQLPAGSIIERFYFNNLTMNVDNTPLLISPGVANHKAPIQNLYFSNMHIIAGSGSIITGWGPGSTSDIYFRDIDIEFKDKGRALIPREEVTPKMRSNIRLVEGKTVSYLHPYGFYIFNPDNISFRNVRLKWTGMEKDKIIPFYAENVRNMSLNSIDIDYPSLKKEDAVMQFKNSENLAIGSCLLSGHLLSKNTMLYDSAGLDITGKDFFG